MLGQQGVMGQLMVRLEEAMLSKRHQAGEVPIQLCANGGDGGWGLKVGK